MHIANNIQGASAPSDGARPFDPADWLARYVELGGGYTANPNGVVLHYHDTGGERPANAKPSSGMSGLCAIILPCRIR